MKLRLTIGGDPGLTPGGRHCDIKLGNYGFSADCQEYLHVSGICKPERAAVLALAFEMRDAITAAIDAIEDGDASGDPAGGRAKAYNTLCAIYRRIGEEIEAAK